MNRLQKRIPTGVLILVTVLVLIPALWAISISFRQSDAVFAPTWIPKPFTLDNYTGLFSDAKYRRWLMNSLFVSGSSTIVALVLGVLTAYGLSRYKMRYGSFLRLFVVSTRMIPPILLSISYFTIIQKLNLYDTLISIVLVHSAMVLPFVILIMQGFLDTIPFEMDEAGMIDGCSRGGVLFRLILPNSLAQLISTATLTFLLSWNEYLFALIFTGSQSKRVFTVGITSLIGQWWTNYPSLMAGAVIAAAPVVIVFLSLQRYIVNSMMQSMFK